MTQLIGYNKNTSFTNRLRQASQAHYNIDNYDNLLKFDFHVSKSTEEVFNKLNNKFDEDIVKRLAYTLFDPFFHQFLNENKDRGIQKVW